MKSLIIAIAAAATLQSVTAQQTQKLWSLNDCITYAHENNISVQKSAVTVEQNAVQLNTARNSRLPDLNASLNGQTSFGRSINRDNGYTNNTQLSGSVNASTSIPIFQGLRIRNQIAASRLDLAAATADLERAKEDLSLNIMSLYLDVLFNKELVGVAESQLTLSRQQAERSRQLFATGKSAESAVYESDALVSKDELSLTQNRNALSLSLLKLSQALNRESADGFDVVIPTLDSITVMSMRTIRNIGDTYAYALDTRPQIKAERIRLESSEKSIRIARAARYPQIAFSAGVGTSVYRSYATGALNSDFWSQIRNNCNEYLGISMSIPIFNRTATRNQIRSSTLSMRTQQLQLTEAEQTLRKEIEQVYYNADAAYLKYMSATKALSSAEVAFDYQREKANAGRSTIFDYNDAKTRMEKAASDAVQAKFEFIFMSKILDFYNGKALTL